MKTSLFVLVTFVATHFLFAQSPGGVSSNLAAWYRGDLGLSSTAWNDQSSNGYNLTRGTNVANNEFLNFNPVATFNNATNNTYSSSSAAKANWPAGNSANTYYYVAFNSSTAANRLVCGIGASGATLGQHSGMAITTANFGSGGTTTLTTTNNAEFSSQTWLSNPTSLVRFGFNGGSAANNYLAVNGNPEVLSSSTMTPTYANTSVFRIGSSGVTAIGNWIGRIGEVVVYSGKHDAATANRVESYLALKYGVTKGGAYVNSSSSTIFNEVIYAHNIAGIAREDNSGLHQKQSRSVNVGRQLVISNGSTVFNTNADNTNSLTDGQFLIWGDNNGAKVLSVPLSHNTGSAEINYRFGSVWKVRNHGDVGTVLVAWPAEIQNMHLVRSSDETFDGSDEFIPMSGSVVINGITHLTATATFNDGDFFTFAGFSQFPGGIAGVSQWYQNTLASATQWQDKSANENHVPVNSNSPTFTKHLNFNPIATFNGTNQRYTRSSGVNNGFTSTSGATSFYVATPANNNLTFDVVHAQGFVSALNSGRYGSRLHAGTVDGNYTHDATIANAWETNVPMMVRGGFNPGAPNNSYVARNGSSEVVSSSTTNRTWTNDFSIGARDNGAGYYWSGDIAEVIVYPTKLTLADYEKVETYLSLKYGITKTGDYVSSSGTTIWNTSINSGYHNSIAGIGRDNVSDLYQKQAISVSQGNQLVIGAGHTLFNTNAANTNTLDNEQFLIWGDNNLAKKLAVTFQQFPPAGEVNYRFGAVWKVQNTGNVDTVVVAWPIGIDNLHLVVSSDEIFDASDDFYEMSQTTSINSKSYNYVKLVLSDGDYFTFAGYGCAPGGVIADIKSWYSAGSISQNDNTEVLTLSDLTGNGYDLVQHTALSSQNDPTFKVNSMNFNPSIEFDGNGDAFFYNTRFFPSTGNGSMIFATSTNVTNSWRILSDIGLYDPNVGIVEVSGVPRGRLYHDPGQQHVSTVNSSFVVPMSTPFIGNYGFTFSPLGGPEPDGRSLVRMNGNSFSLNQSSFRNIGQDLGGRMTLGALGDNGAYWWNGLISEAVYYDRDLSDQERQRIDSYMALKYGVTLMQPMNYLSANSTVIWNSSMNSAYNQNIFGIGNDKLSCLNQKVSRSSNLESILRLSTTNNFVLPNSDASRNVALDDNHFILVGDNGIFTGISPVDPAACELIEDDMFRIDREWLVQETDTVGPIYVQVDLTVFGLNSEIGMLIGDNSGVSGNVSLIPAFSLSGSIATFLVDFKDNSHQYFTFVGKINPPACTNCIGSSVTLKQPTNWNVASNRANNNTGTFNVGAPVQSGQITAVNSVSYNGGAVEYIPNAFPNSFGANWTRISRRDNLSGPSSHVVYKTELNTASKATFVIRGIQSTYGQQTVVQVTGFCGSDAVLPKLNYENPNANMRRFVIDNSPAQAIGTKPFYEYTSESGMIVSFDKPVERIEVVWHINRSPLSTRINYLTISDMRLTCDIPIEPNPDNVFLVQSFLNDEMDLCDETLLELRFINNNCDDREIELISNPLSVGAEYIENSFTGPAAVSVSSNNMTASSLILPPGETVYYVGINASTIGSKEVFATFRVLPPTGTGENITSDDDSGQPGYQTTTVQVNAPAPSPIPTVELVGLNAITSDTTYLPGAGDVVLYTFTFENNDASPISNLRLVNTLGQDASFVSGSLVLGAGITGAPNAYGASGEEQELLIENLQIPVGTSTITIEANMNNSSLDVESLADLFGDNLNTCAATLNSELLAINTPLCFRDGALTADNTVFNVNLVDSCHIDGWIYYYNADREAVIAVNPNGNTWNPSAMSISNVPFANFQTNGVDSAKVAQRAWSISHAGTFATPVSVRLYYNPAELEAQLPTASYPTRGWFKHSGGVADIANDLIPLYLLLTNAVELSPSATGSEFGIDYVQFAVTSFSTFGFTANTSDVVLPVTLTSFSAQCQGDKINVHWTTASEFNASHYVLQSSRDGQIWLDVQEIEAAGTTNQNSHYSVQVDNTGALIYFRLIQVDNDGETTIYGPISSNCEFESNSISVHPNPANIDLTITIKTLENLGLAQVVLTDLMGRVIKQHVVEIASGTTTVLFNVESINTGTYFVRVINEKEDFEVIQVVVKTSN